MLHRNCTRLIAFIAGSIFLVTTSMQSALPLSNLIHPRKFSITYIEFYLVNSNDRS